MHKFSEFLQQTGNSLRNADAACPSQVVEQQADKQSRRFNIYRNNRAVSLIDNLKSTYPAVCQLVGDDFFTAVARHYIKQHPPQSPVMSEYGGSFGRFIKDSPNARSIPYIEDVARLEWSRLQSYHAAESSVLAVDTLQHISPDDYETLCFNPHPSLHLVSSQWPAGSLWAATTNTGDKIKPDMQRAEHVVIVRPALEVLLQILPASGAMLLDCLRQGQPLLQAVEHIMQQDPAFDPGSHLQGLINLGAFDKTYKKGQ